jgi:hypothetical protein
MTPESKWLTDRFVARIVEFNTKETDPEFPCEFLAKEIADVCIGRLIQINPRANELNRHSMYSAMGKSLTKAGFQSRILKGYRLFRGITPEALEKASEPPPPRQV